MLRPMKGLLTTSWWQMTVKAGSRLAAVGMEKVNLVIIWIFGLWGKESAKVDFWQVTSVLDI